MDGGPGGAVAEFDRPCCKVRFGSRGPHLFLFSNGLEAELSFDETHFSHDTLLELEEFSLSVGDVTLSLVY
ncbi:hypothetical protein D5366_11465 (plasmid) [Neokomagataea tanensis]|uniref:Uncharacterized protein n=1 Tax=Neokomagataea tanensis TaxID=661191 RepID=A0A4Y6VC11_9PROT|nr:hypothetical protein D5366_11465 [Neokomagataea tanensis]